LALIVDDSNASCVICLSTKYLYYEQYVGHSLLTARLHVSLRRWQGRWERMLASKMMRPRRRRWRRAVVHGGAHLLVGRTVHVGAIAGGGAGDGQLGDQSSIGHLRRRVLAPIPASDLSRGRAGVADALGARAAVNVIDLLAGERDRKVIVVVCIAFIESGNSIRRDLPLLENE